LFPTSLFFICEMKFIPLYLAFLVLISCNQACKSALDRQKTIQDSLTVAIKAASQSGVFNGFAVAVVNEKGTLYQQGFGFADVAAKKPYTDHTIQNIASISKTLVGIALLKAQELGKLNLDDPINKYLPFTIHNPAFTDMAISIRHLATHTSGIRDNDVNYLSKNYCLKPGQDLRGLKLAFDEAQVFNPPDSLISVETYLRHVLIPGGKWYTKDVFINKKPGEFYEYSNIATTLAAFVIEKATSENFRTFTAKYILKPLKMDASGWRFDDVDFSKHAHLYENPGTPLPFYAMISYPDGNFITSVNDLSLYLTELIKGYNGHGTILKKESYKELFRPQLLEKNFEDRNVQNPYSESYNVGILIGFGYTGYIGHTGGDPGVATMMFFDPGKNIGRILFVNTSFSGREGNNTFYSIWDQLEKYQERLADEN
jgi:CubicO group peptidase (beta-lactamase class C family)